MQGVCLLCLGNSQTHLVILSLTDNLNSLIVISLKLILIYKLILRLLIEKERQSGEFANKKNLLSTLVIGANLR